MDSISAYRPTSDYNVAGRVEDDAAEFGRAMQTFMRERRRPFPTAAEVLAVARSLGYRRVAPPVVKK